MTSKGTLQAVMKFCYLLPLAIMLGACTTNPAPKREHAEAQFDVRISTTDIGGFKMQMTPRAALAVIKAKGYRESAGNRVTLEDLVSGVATHDARIEVFEFSYGESLDDRLMKETGIFNLDFSKGRIEGINYEFVNLTQEKLKAIRERNEVIFDFVKSRETKPLNTPRGGVVTSWFYEPNKFAFLRINYLEREPRFAQPRLGDSGIGACDYSITVFDANPYLLR